MVLLGGQRVKTVASLSRSQWGNPDFCFTGWNMTESPQLKNWSFQNNQLVISTACFNLNCFSPCPWSGIILGMDSANERRCYSVTSSLIGWAQTQNDPCLWMILSISQKSWMYYDPWRGHFYRFCYVLITFLWKPTCFLSKTTSFNKAYHPGGHYWEYYPGALSWSQGTATHLKLRHP